MNQHGVNWSLASGCFSRVNWNFKMMGDGHECHVFFQLFLFFLMVWLIILNCRVPKQQISRTILTNKLILLFMFCLCLLVQFISKVKIFICNFKFSIRGIYLSKSIETTKQQSVRNVWLLLNISFLEYAVNCLDVFFFVFCFCFA